MVQTNVSLVSWLKWRNELNLGKNHAVITKISAWTALDLLLLLWDKFPGYIAGEVSFPPMLYAFLAWRKMTLITKWK